MFFLVGRNMVHGELLMGWSKWGPSSHPQGSDVGQLVTDSRFSTSDLFIYQIRSTGPDGSLPFFEEKPRIML
jgi:hypothetical protein